MKEEINSSVVLSIGIPTYNRAPYLKYLLNKLCEQRALMRHNYEILISDNASTDHTELVVQEFVHLLPIRYFRNKENLGGEKNNLNCIKNAHGEYYIYLADDDFIYLDQVNNKISFLRQNKKVAALYAPWDLFSAVSNTKQGQFYKHDDCTLIKNKDYLSLAKFITKNHIFSEIGIYRRSSLLSIQVVNSLAFWAFTIPAEFCGIGDIYYDNVPFYASITAHPADGGSRRIQAGNEEAMVAWDRYRGGLEHLVGLARTAATGEDLQELFTNMETMVNDRMLVALRLRFNSQSDPIENYFLASRLRGRGIKINELPLIRARAAINWLSTKVAAHYNAKRIVLSPKFKLSDFDKLLNAAAIPIVEYVSEIKEGDILLGFGHGGVEDFDIKNMPHSFYISEEDLLLKYP